MRIAFCTTLWRAAIAHTMGTKTPLYSRTGTFAPHRPAVHAFLEVMFDFCAVGIRDALVTGDRFCRMPEHYSLTSRKFDFLPFLTAS